MKILRIDVPQGDTLREQIWGLVLRKHSHWRIERASRKGDRAEKGNSELHRPSYPSWGWWRPGSFHWACGYSAMVTNVTLFLLSFFWVGVNARAPLSPFILEIPHLDFATTSSTVCIYVSSKCRMPKEHLEIGSRRTRELGGARAVKFSL